MNTEQAVTLVFADGGDSFQEKIQQILKTAMQEGEATWIYQK